MRNRIKKFLGKLNSFIFSLFKKVNKIKDDSTEHSWTKQTILFVLGAVLILVMGRGTGLRPIEPINTTAFVQDEKVNLVLNSAFTVVKSWGRASLETKNYFEDSELKALFDPIHTFKSNPNQLNKPNVVILLLESFSVEYIASINGSVTFVVMSIGLFTNSVCCKMPK